MKSTCLLLTCIFLLCALLAKAQQEHGVVDFKLYKRLVASPDFKDSSFVRTTNPLDGIADSSYVYNLWAKVSFHDTIGFQELKIRLGTSQNFLGDVADTTIYSQQLSIQQSRTGYSYTQVYIGQFVGKARLYGETYLLYPSNDVSNVKFLK